MSILTWHFLSFKIINILIVSIYKLDYSKVGQHPTIIEYANMGWFIIYTIIGIAIPLAIIAVKNKILNFLYYDK